MPIPSFLAVSWAMARASPVTILTLDAHLPGGRDGGLGIVARRIEQRQHAQKLPVAIRIGPRHAQRTESRVPRIH